MMQNEDGKNYSFEDEDEDEKKNFLLSLKCNANCESSYKQ